MQSLLNSLHQQWRWEGMNNYVGSSLSKTILFHNEVA